MGVCPCSNEKSISNKEIIREGHIIGHPESLTKNATLKMIDQMEKSVCNIIKEEMTGTGFICIIPFPDKLHPLPVLITCHHVLRKEDLEIGKKIKLIFNENEKIIEINKSRKIYTSDENNFDISIIELIQKDNFNSNNFLELDDDIFKDEALNAKYRNKSIYIIHFPEGKESQYSVGVIKNIDEDNILIRHQCSTKDGSSGGPIFNLQTFSIIGMHQGRHESFNYNIGIILSKPIKEFKEKFINDLNNIIGKNNINNNSNKNNDNIKYLENKSKMGMLNKVTTKEGTPKSENSITIEIIENYIYKINYNLNNNNIKDIGLLVKIPNNSIKGFLTNYHIDEKALYDIKIITIFNNKGSYEYNTNNIFIFSDQFLNTTFIGIDQLELEYIDIIKENNILENPLLIKYSEENNNFDYIESKILGKWGINIFYKEEKNYYDCDSVSYKLALIIDQGIIGIHKNIDYHYNIAINTEIIAKALILNYSNNKNNCKYVEEESIPLDKNQIKELNEHKLEFTNVPNILISLPSLFVTPIWFYRTKHAWYWTPTKPQINEINKVNWMIIFPDNSLKVIGGEWDGIEPAGNNIEIIRWLETTKLKYNTNVVENE